MNDDLEHGEHDHESKIVSSTGELLFSENTRERTKERNRESQEYVSVIVKRVDETFRHPDDILEKAIDVSGRRHDYNRWRLNQWLQPCLSGLGLSPWFCDVYIKPHATFY